MKDAKWLSYWLMILIFGTATGYDLQCPAKSEWRLRANVSCNSEDKYVCLFHLLENKYEENCLGSDLSSIGNKLVFQPLFNLAECNTGRYQPIVFTTHGNSDCILLKSKCDEEGQVVHSNGTSGNDTACRCDYARGYAFVSKPKHSCLCLPSEEDCSCFRAKCPNLSANYKCIADGNTITKTKCQEIHPPMSYNIYNRTGQYTKININSYSHAYQDTRFIIVTIAVCTVVTVIAAFSIYIFGHISSTTIPSNTNEENQKLIKEECGKHHFARIIFIGQNGVGKTSLMKRLLWGTKKDVSSSQSTDGIEIEKCNINVENGKWSRRDKIDDDLVRMIQQVYTQKKINEGKASKTDSRENEIIQVDTNYKAEKTNISINDNFDSKDTISDKNEVEKLRSNTKHDENDDDRLYEYESKSDSENDKKLSIQVQKGKEHTVKSEISDAVKIKESNLNQVEAETINYIHSKDNQIKSNEIENEAGSEYDENVDEMTSTIMKSCFRQNVDDPNDMLASCWLWDFAGQKDFYATHQVFLSTCAVYLLVTDSLEFSAAEKLWTGFENSTQYVRFWFDAIHCYWSVSQKDRLDPPIIVVCTKGDTFQNLKERKKRETDFTKSLLKVLGRQEKKKHLRNIYFVSNTKDDGSVFEEIRNEISRHAMDMNEWGRDCPLKWLLFQQVLGKLKDSSVPISTTTKLSKIAKHGDICITSDEEFTRCLQYFHDTGTVIYFEEANLKDYVILDPKWLIDAFRCLVSDKIEPTIDNSDDWQNLTETGVLTDKLITDLFKKEPKLNFFENKSHLLEVMKRFDIIVNLKNSNALYMPCMIESCSFAEVRKQFMDENNHFHRTSWLCLEFMFLPPAFFNHIMAWYIKQYSVSIILEKGSRKERKAIYRQIGVFNLDYSGCEQLVICEGPNIIALQVWNSQRSDKTYGDLRTKLCQFVESLRNRYRLKIRFTQSFKCYDGDFTINQQKLSILSSEEYRCLEHKTNHLSKDLVQPWYTYQELMLEEEKERKQKNVHFEKLELDNVEWELDNVERKQKRKQKNVHFGKWKLETFRKLRKAEELHEGKIFRNKNADEDEDIFITSF